MINQKNQRNHKLTTDKVSVIKRQLLNGEWPRDIANQNNVSVRIIHRIERKETWKNVEPSTFDPELDYDPKRKRYPPKLVRKFMVTK